MRQLFLHAGLPKTGTTYLQKLFLRNREALAGAGLGFGPHQDAETGSHYPRFVEAIEARGAAAVLDETEACPGERLLVSNEDLAHFLLTPLGFPARPPARPAPPAGPGPRRSATPPPAASR